MVDGTLMRRVAVLLIVTVGIFGLRAVGPGVPQAQAGLCDIPLVGPVVCGVGDALFAAAGGVTGVLSKSGDIVDKVTGKVIATVTKHLGALGCTVGVDAATDGVAMPVALAICKQIADKLAGLIKGPSGTPTPPAAAPTPPAAPPATPPTTPTTAPAADGSPASAFSTAGMAALAGAATLFVADNVTSLTHVTLATGWFPGLYDKVMSYAWLLAILAVCFTAMSVMVTQRGADLALMLGRIPLAGVLMIMVPVLTMLGVDLVDQLCGDMVNVFHGGVTALHILAAVLGVLAGTSVGAGALHLPGLAHVTGTAAWMIGGFGLLVSGGLAVELIAREVAIYLSVLIVPFALIGEIFSPFAKWATGLMRGLFVIIVSKLLLTLGLVMVGLLVTSGSIMDVIVALTTLLIIVFVPALVYGALIRVESAWHTSIGRNAMSAPSMSMAQQVKAAHGRVQDNIARRRAPTPPTPDPAY